MAKKGQTFNQYTENGGGSFYVEQPKIRNIK